jgi:hypothetical protein
LFNKAFSLQTEGGLVNMKTMHIFIVPLLIFVLLFVAAFSKPVAKAESFTLQPAVQNQSFAATSMGWKVYYVDTGSLLDYDPSLAVDIYDRSHIIYSYADKEFQTLKYAVLDGTSWYYETVHSAIMIRYPDIKLETIDDNDWARVSFDGFYEDGWRLMYTERYDTDSWSLQQIQKDINGGSSLAFTSGGFPRIAYSGSSAELMIAILVGSDGNCGPTGKEWNCILIDGTSSFGSISLALEDDPLLPYHISYYDGDNHVLKYARILGPGLGNCGPSDAWQCDVIDSGADVGGGSSLILDENDDPIISYYDLTNGTLKLASLAGSAAGNCGPGNSWSCIVVDPKAEGSGIARTSISNRLDPLFLPRIGYSNLKYVAEMKLATNIGASGDCGSGADWNCQALPFGGIFEDSALDSRGLSHLVYGTDALMYARSGFMRYLPLILNKEQGGG